MSLFVDTTVWYAAADRGDGSNECAREILSTGDRLFTTDHILVEAWLLLRHRLHRSAAERFWDGLRSGVAELEPVGAADLASAWAIGEAFQDQDFSIVDRTSFAVMQRLGLRRVATFDDDFAVYRFGKDRREAFSIVR
ncbi:MAG: type II toxin-antitoxin system VapC family toxin [Gemmatimonadota bacterium]